MVIPFDGRGELTRASTVRLHKYKHHNPGKVLTIEIKMFTVTNQDNNSQHFM